MSVPGWAWRGSNVVRGDDTTLERQGAGGGGGRGFCSPADTEARRMPAATMTRASPRQFGSTTGLADSNGDLTDTYHYDAFGAAQPGTGSSEQAFRFAGEQQDDALANDL